jgi:hypothetical protein
MASVNLDRMKPEDRHGSLCEWSVAMGLGLKLTSGKFSSRDGRTREQQAVTPATIPLAAQAEVVDLSRAIDRGRANEIAKPEAANA